MGMFKNILVRAHHGDKEAVDKLYEQYKPLLRKYSFVNGVFDEDLHHILVISRNDSDIQGLIFLWQRGTVAHVTPPFYS